MAEITLRHTYHGQGSSKLTGSPGCLLFILLFATYCARRRDGSPSHLLIYDCLFRNFAPCCYWFTSNGSIVNTLCLPLLVGRSYLLASRTACALPHRHIRGNPKVLFSIGGCLCNKVSKAPRLPARLVNDSTITTLFYRGVCPSFLLGRYLRI